MAEGYIDIANLAKRSGVAASALRFYEEQGLIRSARQGGGRRHFPRSTLRRVAFVRAAQAVGLTLEEIRAALATLPDERTPTREDWASLSSAWKPLIDERIAALTRLRDALSSCIGCGCLSLDTCALYNPADGARRRGPGPRYLLGDNPASVMAEAKRSEAA
ncbi:MAG TPA: redox-sensitive transcriptional activator SoxR [Caulobacteraceae bacterium]|nr:redox-sensitive transcriptional activator SoxR [Caulobacteraceae bacterium]